MNFKKYFLEHVRTEQLIEALKKGYISIDDLDAEDYKDREVIIKYYISSNEKIPQEVLDNLSVVDCVRWYYEVDGTKNKPFKEKLLSYTEEEVQECIKTYSAYLFKERIISVLSDEDIAEKWLPYIAKITDITSNRYSFLRKCLPEFWVKLKNKRRELGVRCSTSSGQKYRHKLEEAIKTNSTEPLINSRITPQNISDTEFERLLPDWLKTKPELKVYLLETPQFKNLPMETQINIIKSCSSELLNEYRYFYFPKQALKEIDVRVAYAVLRRDIKEYKPGKRIITPPLDDKDLRMFTPLIVAYPDKVGTAVKIYKCINVIEKIKQDKYTPPIDGEILTEQQEYFVKSVINGLLCVYDIDEVNILFHLLFKIRLPQSIIKIIKENQNIRFNIDLKIVE